MGASLSWLLGRMRSLAERRVLGRFAAAHHSARQRDAAGQRDFAACAAAGRPIGFHNWRHGNIGAVAHGGNNRNDDGNRDGNREGNADLAPCRNVGAVVRLAGAKRIAASVGRFAMNGLASASAGRNMA